MELGIQIAVYSIIIIVAVLNLLKGVLNYKNRKSEIPNNVKDVYDEDKYQKWLEYDAEKFRVSMIKKCLSLIVSLGLLASGFYVVLNNLLLDIGINDLIMNAILFLLITNLIKFIISVCFDYYDTFVIEEKYGFNKKTKGLFFKDLIKIFIVFNLVISVVVGVILYFYTTLAEMFIVYASIFLFVVAFIFMALYAKVFSKMSNKFTALEEGSLKTKIEEFANKVNFDIKEISVMDGSRRSNKGNAYCSGFGKLKRIVLYDTLIKQCTEEEIVAILAHEIGHSKHKHQLKGMPLALLTIVFDIIVLFAFLELEVFSQAFGFTSVNYGFAIVMFFICMSPISMIVGIFTNIFSRKNEYQADRFAANNYDKKYLISGLKTISRENFVNLTPHKFTVLLDYSHPPMNKRIEAIEKL